MMKIENKRILFVEDNQELLKNLMEYFGARHNEVYGAKSRREATNYLRNGPR